MIYTAPKETWAAIVDASKKVTDARVELQALWEGLAENLKFILPSMTIVDEDKGQFDAEPRPSETYNRQKQILLITDALHRLTPEERKEVAGLAEIDPKINLSFQLQLVQEGADAKDAVQAEPTKVAELDDVHIPEGAAIAPERDSAPN